MIAAIYQEMAGTGATVTESALVDGREVDVLIESEAIAGVTARITVECRDHKRRQDVTWIEELQGKQSTLRISETFAVSSSGFTAKAITAAREHGRIHLLTLEEAGRMDWRSAFRSLGACCVKARQHLKLMQVTPSTSEAHLSENGTIRIGARCMTALEFVTDVRDNLVYPEAYRQAIRELLQAPFSPPSHEGPERLLARSYVKVEVCGVTWMEGEHEYPINSIEAVVELFGAMSVSPVKRATLGQHAMITTFAVDELEVHAIEAAGKDRCALVEKRADGTIRPIAKVPLPRD